MNQDYKVEIQPSIWAVAVSSGAYSDYQENIYYIRANEDIEAWHLFKRYWVSVIDDESHDYDPPCLIYNKEEFEPFSPREKYGHEPKESWNWDTSYGDANNVSIYPLSLIRFEKCVLSK